MKSTRLRNETMHRKPCCRVLLPTALLLMGAAAERSVAEETVDLRPKFTSGARHYLELAQNIEDQWEASSFGPATTTETVWTRGVVREIGEPMGDGDHVVTLIFDRIYLSAPTQSETAVYDSDTDDPQQSANASAAVGRPMIGKKIVLFFTERGRGAGVVGMGGVLDEVDYSASGNMVLEPLLSDFMEDTTRFTWGHAPYALYAFSEVKVGDTWSLPVRRFDYYLGDLDYSFQCRLDGIGVEKGRKVAKVSFKATIKPVEKGREAARFMTLQLVPKSGEATGTAVFDVAHGEFVRQTQKTTMAITASMTPKPDEEPVTFGLKRTIDETLTRMSEDERAEAKVRRRGKREAETKN